MAPTPVFLPGESQGWGSLVGCRLWGRTESDTTEVTWQYQFAVTELSECFLCSFTVLSFISIKSFDHLITQDVSTFIIIHILQVQTGRTRNFSLGHKAGRPLLDFSIGNQPRVHSQEAELVFLGVLQSPSKSSGALWRKKQSFCLPNTMTGLQGIQQCSGSVPDFKSEEPGLDLLYHWPNLLGQVTQISLCINFFPKLGKPSIYLYVHDGRTKCHKNNDS